MPAQAVGPTSRGLGGMTAHWARWAGRWRTCGSARLPEVDQTAIATRASAAVCGEVKAGFEAVADAFAHNFAHRNELGAACCIYAGGEKVVDLWGGIRVRRTEDPWEEDTMVCVFSATKA